MKLNYGFLARRREAARLLQFDAPASVTAPATDLLTRVRRALQEKWKRASARQAANAGPQAMHEASGKSRFLSGSCTNHAGTRPFKLYIPAGYKGQAVPLIVMLHGCGQHPDDFAAGTGMNAIAELNNCLVVYPAQMKAVNNCWTWFKANHQQRDRGEPSIIADITRAVIRKYRIDKRRVYIAGLSAGGAMAAIMAARYPDLYAAVGIHSGMPVGAAHDWLSAFAAMKNGKAHAADAGPRKESVPVIVFHGDHDTTVHPRNGDLALAQCAEQQQATDVTVEKGKVPHGRAYTRTIRRDRTGTAISEHWVVHGSGHAWSGGSRNGSCTDPQGPNATWEMVRFFRAHTRRRDHTNLLDWWRSNRFFTRSAKNVVQFAPSNRRGVEQSGSSSGS